MVENDELVPVREAEDIIETLGRGYLIIDKTEEADKKTDRLAHDMDNMPPPEKIIDFVNITLKPKKKIITI